MTLEEVLRAPRPGRVDAVVARLATVEPALAEPDGRRPRGASRLSAGTQHVDFRAGSTR